MKKKNRLMLISILIVSILLIVIVVERNNHLKFNGDADKIVSMRMINIIDPVEITDKKTQQKVIKILKKIRLGKGLKEPYIGIGIIIEIKYEDGKEDGFAVLGNSISHKDGINLFKGTAYKELREIVLSYGK
jgi:hypothetical protein